MGCVGFSLPGHTGADQERLPCRGRPSFVCEVPDAATASPSPRSEGREDGQRTEGSETFHGMLRYPLLYHPSSQKKAWIGLNQALFGPLFLMRGGVEGCILKAYEHCKNLYHNSGFGALSGFQVVSKLLTDVTGSASCFGLGLELVDGHVPTFWHFYCAV